MSDRGYRRSEVSELVGHGDAVWERATTDVLQRRVKTTSGFAVDSTGPVSQGDRVMVIARVLTVTVVEPVQVWARDSMGADDGGLVAASAGGNGAGLLVASEVALRAQSGTVVRPVAMAR